MGLGATYRTRRGTPPGRGHMTTAGLLARGSLRL